VEPPGSPDKPPEHYILPPTEDYVKALGKLQTDMSALAQNPDNPDPAALASAAASSSSASAAVVTMFTKVPVDSQFRNQDQVQRLLEEPIKGADDLIKLGPLQAAKGAASEYCKRFGQLTDKYPFDPKSSQQATLDQLYSVFGPTGADWKNLNEKVQPIAMKVGSKFVANPAAKVAPSAGYLLFLTRVEGLSEALYPSGSAPPHLSYTLKELKSNLQGVELKIGSETLSGEGTAKGFVWSGAPEDIVVNTKGGDTLYSFTGPWAIFKFISTANYLGGGKLEWVSEINGQPVQLPGGKIKSFDYQLEVSGPENPFFDLRGMKCADRIAAR
jgi:type VI secretion system protein ImpL